MRSICGFFLMIGMLGSTFSLSAQASFHVPDTIKYLSKDTGFNTLHDFIEVKNLTSDSLNMRWKQRRVRYPSGWTTTLQDPTIWHNPVDGLDSADFVLPDSVSAPYKDLMIIGVDHNGIAGQGVVIFTVFEQGHPEDSVRLYFDVQVKPKIGLEERGRSALTVYPNPAEDEIFLEGFRPGSLSKVYMYNSSGSCIELRPEPLGMDRQKISTANLARGFYILSISDNSYKYHQKVYLH